MKKKFYRSQKEKKIMGVCGGLAEYFGFDVTFIRLTFILTSFLLGFGLLVYIILSFITPKATDYTPYKEITDSAESKRNK